jgi:hypothetical protein
MLLLYHIGWPCQRGKAKKKNFLENNSCAKFFVAHGLLRSKCHAKFFVARKLQRMTFCQAGGSPAKLAVKPNSEKKAKKAPVGIVGRTIPATRAGFVGQALFTVREV